MKKRRKKIPKDVRDSVFFMDGHKCLKCGSKEDLTIDHIKSIAHGGGNEAGNLQTLCAKCNTKKGMRKVNHRTTTNYHPKNNKNANNGIYSTVYHGDQRIIVKK